MTTQQMLSPFRKAIEQWNMISEGDKIAVGVSGGKDSLTLLQLLHAFKRFSPKSFELAAITIDLGFTKDDAYLPVADFCKKMSIPYYVEKTEIAQIIFDERKETSPCSLCSKMRRGALNNKLNELGFNKLALGHHADDVIETFFLSLFFEGRLSTFAPVAYMDRSEITLIRPMVLIWENEISSYSTGLPIVFNPCPADKHTKRQYIKEKIENLKTDIPFIKQRILSSIISPERYNLWDNDFQKNT